MANNYFLCVIEEMDRLWFHQVILFSEPTSKAAHKPVEEEKPFPISESLPCNSSMFSLLPLPDDDDDDETSTTDESPSPQKEQVSSTESISSPLQDGSINNREERKESLARMNVLGNRIRSHSSSPSSQHSNRRFRNPATKKLLQKSMSCRTLGELELNEVKGFMDLGFIFKKETLSPRMISVVPGLQRLGLHKNKHNNNNTKLMDVTEEIADKKETESEEEEKRVIMRPYLSEAWLIKRPDSPLLSLKIPKACSATSMKKHLRFWAKTVASEIHQE